MQVDVLLARLGITPRLHPVTSWGPLSLSNWHQSRWGGQVSGSSYHWDRLCRARPGEKVSTGFLLLGMIHSKTGLAGAIPGGAMD